MTKKEQQIYVSPKVKTIEIKIKAIICQSGENQSMYERKLDEDDFESL